MYVDWVSDIGAMSHHFDSWNCACRMNTCTFPKACGTSGKKSASFYYSFLNSKRFFFVWFFVGNLGKDKKKIFHSRYYFRSQLIRPQQSFPHSGNSFSLRLLASPADLMSIRGKCHNLENVTTKMFGLLHFYEEKKSMK